MLVQTETTRGGNMEPSLLAKSVRLLRSAEDLHGVRFPSRSLRGQMPRKQPNMGALAHLAFYSWRTLPQGRYYETHTT